MAAGPRVGLPGVSELGRAAPAAWGQVLGWAGPSKSRASQLWAR